LGDNWDHGCPDAARGSIPQQPSRRKRFPAGGPHELIEAIELRARGTSTSSRRWVTACPALRRGRERRRRSAASESRPCSSASSRSRCLESMTNLMASFTFRGLPPPARCRCPARAGLGPPIAKTAPRCLHARC